MHVLKRIMVDPRDEAALDPNKPGKTVINGIEIKPRPRWLVAPTCPNCGAIVDQTVEDAVEHPTCAYCHEPLPVQPA